SGPTSPIVNILTEIAAETRLTEDRSLIGNEAVNEGIGRVAQIEARSNLSIQGEILLEALRKSTVASGNGEAVKEPGEYVQERFDWLNQLVARPEGQNSQLDMLIATLQEVYQELNKMSFSGVAATAVDGGTATQRFQQMAARIPGPLERWASQITTSSTGITADGTRSSINAAWQSTVLPFCTQALENRYPFNRRARADVAMADFQKLFAPGGMIDVFFSTNLSKYVDTRSRPWAWKKVNDVDLGISPAVLQQLQYAAEIRDAFFAGGANPQVQFQITPEALDPKADSVQLTIGSQNVLFETRRPNNTPVAITWPGTVGLAGVVFQPKLKNGESQLAKDGPWAWFRLLDAAEIRRTNVSDRKRVIFNISGRIAIFQLQSGSVINPFALPALSKFNCPKTF
ncbi:MAG: type VI secretion system membrane subunit TssM, partial [Sulfitobacter sp.]|nr:type VI secretion system membrane subunit TssM [Sulfitobacter sp.]